MIPEGTLCLFLCVHVLVVHAHAHTYIPTVHLSVCLCGIKLLYCKLMGCKHMYIKNEYDLNHSNMMNQDHWLLRRI